MSINYGFLGFINGPEFESDLISDSLYETADDCKKALIDYIAFYNSDLDEDAIPYDYSMCEIKFAKEENGWVTILS